MPTINLLNQTATTKSTDQNAANLINMYLVEDQDQGKYSKVAYPTPGDILFSAGSSVVRAMLTVHGITYGIDGNTFFSMDSNGTRATLGTLNTSSGWAKIKSLNAEIFIADSSNGYYYIPATNTFGTIVNSSQGGVVQNITILTSGTGYTSPIISFTGGGGSGAAATAILSSGTIVSITVTAGGSGYTSTPTVVITDSTGTGATATSSIATSSFPTSIQDISAQDEFGLVLATNSQTWSASAISDLTTWPNLSFASTTGNQDYNVAIESCHRELFIFKTFTTEVWDNNGTANFTFGRNTSVFIEWGCPAPRSVAKGNNTLYFLAQAPSGGNVIMTFDGSYTPTKISNRAIDYQISTFSTTSDAYGFIYQMEGHEFYVITFPTAQVTFSYDITTGQWHQRQSLIRGNQVNWFASCYTYNNNKCLIGDSNSGNIYQLSMATNTEHGNAITRTLVTHPFYQDGVWIFLDKLQIDFDNSPGINLSNWNLYVSRDGGRTYGSAKAATPVQDANGMYRVYWLRLGIAKTYVLKLSTNANIQPIILGAWANYHAATNG